ncbi:MAG: archease [Desulfobacterales bacterium]|uniref:Archease n=1 Tax=Candidatus Desulfatibia profunda TaxID=2841695 RepID=A0A8J6NUL3_9BACT|nr:archease [Candidatus Desulfatibia profunda]MBL7180750.1 archease [Desulfobacterales bacterium]
MGIRKKYKLIDHTADFGIHVFGSDPKELFVNAAHAVFDMLTQIDALKGRETADLRVAGDDWSDLMVNWLRELLYLWNGRELLVKKVHIYSISETELAATLELDPFDPDRHIIKMEIKAVTYHQIQVKCGPKGWEAKIIFDV